MNSSSAVALSDVLVDAKPGFACGEDLQDGLFQFRMNNITVDGQLDLTKRRRVPRDIPNIERYLVEVGDVLFNATNSADLVGKAAYFPGLEEPAVFSNHFLRMRPASKYLDGRYLSRWLNLQYEQGAFKGMCRKWVNQATVNRDALLTMRIPLPPLAEQRRIAEILDKADALRVKRRASPAQLDIFTRSIFLDIFGDSVCERWRMTTVGDIGDGPGAIRTGPFGSQLLHSEFVGDGVAVLGIDNAVENEFRWTQRRFITEAKYRKLTRYSVRPGDVLITLMGTCGRCAVVPDDIPVAVNTKHLCCITVDRAKCLPEFLHSYFLMHPIARRYLRQAAKGAIMDGLNMGIIKEMPIPLAPVELQERYREMLQKVTEVRARARRSASEFATMFASLQHRAFRGEL